MTNSYDEKIRRDIDRRAQREKQRRAKRREELRKQYTAIAVCLVILLVVVIFLFKSCGNGEDNNNVPQTTSNVVTTMRETVTTEEESETPEAETGSEGEVTVNKYMYTTDVLNFREEPSTEANLIMHLQIGAKVKVLSVQGEWAKIKYKAFEGYVKYEYLSEEKDSQE